MIERTLRYMEERRMQRNRNFLRLPLGWDEFRRLLTAHADAIIEGQNRLHRFEWDANVEQVARRLFEYSASQTSNRGIALVGKYGCGKTLLMRAFVEMHNNFVVANQLRVSTYRYAIAADLFRVCADPMRFDEYSVGPLVIDELGREELVGKNYGTTVSPVIDLLFKRYEVGAPTHITSNFKLESLIENYGKMLGDRFREMFEFVEMSGNSRRK